MRGRKRPADERARAVGIAVVAGGAEASRQTGIPERTIQLWAASPEFAELRARNREEVASEWYVFVQHAFRRADALLDASDDPVKVATAGAIMFDKMQLASGGATARTESRSLADDLPDHESEVLGELVRDELARRKDQDAPKPAVESPAQT